MVAFYKLCKKRNEIQLTKIKMDLNNRNTKNHPPSPAYITYKTQKSYTQTFRSLAVFTAIN